MSKFLKKIKKALIIGIGGGADIVGTIPMKSYLEEHGIECYLGGLPWERYSIDPYPGPRRFSEIQKKRNFNQSICFITAKTLTKDGLQFSESKVANFVKNKIIFVNIFNSIRSIAADLIEFINDKKIDYVVGVDVGGDVLALGDEKGLASPLADSIMLNVLKIIEAKCLTHLGVLGYGSDGELKISEINKCMAIASSKKGLVGSVGLSTDAYKTMKEIVKKVETDASRIPLLSFEGSYGNHPIRRGRIQVEVHPMSQITFLFSPTIVFKNLSKPARLISKSKSFYEANEILLTNNISSEFNYEVKKHMEISSLNNKG